MRSAARLLAERFPNAATATWVFLRLRRSAREFSRAGRAEGEPADLVRASAGGRLLETTAGLTDLRLDEAPVVASQQLDELLPLLERVRELQPRRVCEVGTSAAGTLYLLTRISASDALIVSVDISIPLHTRGLRARLAGEHQRLVSIEGDSHADETVSRLEGLLEGEPLDLLFIDGDHSYDGVRADFERYGRLVRPGGLIALHDVNEDFRTRHGVDSPSISGEVPRFWQELKQSHKTEELIANPEQDGFGIGLVYV
jgi:predicted O-methyltransferase YrrM